MFRSARTARVVAAAAALVVSSESLPTFAQTINSIVSLGQLNWQNTAGAPIAPDGTSSIWGELTLNITPDPAQTFYVNMSAKPAGSGGPGAWMVQNLPIFSSSVGELPNQ